MKRSESIFKGILATGSIYTIYGLNSVFCKDALNGGAVSPELLFTLRTSLAAMLFWVLSVFLPKQEIEIKDKRRILYASFLCIIIPQYSTLFGLTYSTPFDASLISTLKPVITFVIVCLLGRDAFRLRSLAGVAVAMIGMLLLILDSRGSDPVFQTKWQGLILLLLNGVSFSFYLILFGDLTKKYRTVTLMKWMLLTASIISLPFSYDNPVSLSLIYTNRQLLWELGFIIIFATFGCYLLMPVGQRNLTATQYSILSYLQCIVASFVGVYMGLDEISPQKIGATLLFIIGVILIKRSTPPEKIDKSSFHKPLKHCIMDEKLMTNPYYAKAIEYIRNNDLNALENGKHLIDGEDLFVNIVDSNMKTPQQARLEVHDKYIDIQIPLSKGETFGVKPRSECTQPDGEMNTEKDILFYHDPVEETISAEIGDIITFAPEMAHAPLIGEGTIHKAIFKVKVV